MRRQGVNISGTSNIEEDAAGDDGRDCCAIALEDAEVAAELGLGEAVVPVVVGAGCDVREAVDLGGDIVVDKQGVAVPAGVTGIGLRINDSVLLRIDAAGRAKRHDFAWRMAGPFEALAAVGDSEVVDFALLGQMQGSGLGLVGHGVECADFVVFAPDPAPAFAALPALDLPGGFLGDDRALSRRPASGNENLDRSEQK